MRDGHSDLTTGHNVEETALKFFFFSSTAGINIFQEVLNFDLLSENDSDSTRQLTERQQRTRIFPKGSRYTLWNCFLSSLKKKKKWTSSLCVYTAAAPSQTRFVYSRPDCWASGVRFSSIGINWSWFRVMERKRETWECHQYVDKDSRKLGKSEAFTSRVNEPPEFHFWGSFSRLRTRKMIFFSSLPMFLFVLVRR